MLEILEADVYAKSGVWDMSKVCNILPTHLPGLERFLFLEEGRVGLIYLLCTGSDISLQDGFPQGSVREAVDSGEMWHCGSGGRSIVA